MVQNHLLQVLCLVAMEPPITFGERTCATGRSMCCDRCVRSRPSASRPRPIAARYRAGRVGDRAIPAYVDEDGVAPERGTETFAEVALELDSWRWSGTRFLMRTGKAMAAARKEVVVHFRSVPHPLLQQQGALPNQLRFGLEPEGLSLDSPGPGRASNPGGAAHASAKSNRQSYRPTHGSCSTCSADRAPCRSAPMKQSNRGASSHPSSTAGRATLPPCRSTTRAQSGHRLPKRSDCPEPVPPLRCGN